MKIAVSVFVFGWYKKRKDHSIYGPVQVLNDSPNCPPAIEMAHQFNYFTTQARPMLSKSLASEVPSHPALVNMPGENLFCAAFYSVTSEVKLGFMN